MKDLTKHLGKRDDTIKSAKLAASKISEEHPGMYVTVFACFGLYLSCHKRLNVFAPSDSYIKSYWLNGKEKPFTRKQKIANDLATPTMS